MFLLNNVFTKDYKEDTKQYLESHGRAGDIDRIIPKTKAELERDAAREKMTIIERTSELTATVDRLEKTITRMHWEIGNLTAIHQEELQQQNEHPQGR
ncbi:unnamed protein product [Chrysoparadoxa australica]